MVEVKGWAQGVLASLLGGRLGRLLGLLFLGGGLLYGLPGCLEVGSGGI